MLPEDFLTADMARTLMALESPTTRLSKIPGGKEWRLLDLGRPGAPISMVKATIGDLLVSADLVDAVTGALSDSGRQSLEQARTVLSAPQSDAPAPKAQKTPKGARPAAVEAAAAALDAAQPLALADSGGPPAPPLPLTAEPDAEKCPVIPLGKSGELIWVLTRMGELMSISPKVTANVFINVFDGDPRWLINNFRRLDKDGFPTNDFVVREAYGWFVRQSVARGIFDPSVGQRAVGVWRGPKTSAGEAIPVVHVGNRILVLSPPERGGEPDARGAGDDQTWRVERPGWRHDRALYLVRPAIDAPDLGNPATAEDGRELVRLLDAWAWEQPFEAMLFAGWLGAALYGGYPDWRVHALLAAEFGSGKSTLLDVAKALLGAMARDFNDITEAGARAALSNEARCIVIDEAEGGQDGKILRVIELLRRMAGGDGASVARGSPGQALHENRVTGCALMAGINPPALDPADRSRIIRLELRKLTAGDPEKAEKIKDRTAWVGRMSCRFRARALTHWRLFNDCLRLYRAGLITSGCDGRQADMLSVLLAGHEVLTADTLPTSDDIAERIEALAGHVALMRETDAESGDAQRCLNHLLSYETPDRRGGETNTVGNLIALARAERDDRGPYRRAIQKYGLRLAVVMPEMQAKYPAKTGHLIAGHEYLLVSNEHGGLNRIFSGGAAKWGRGNWNASLKRLDSAIIQPWPKTERFAGASTRCIAIPCEGDWLPPPDDGAGDPSVPPGGRETEVIG